MLLIQQPEFVMIGRWQGKSDIGEVCSKLLDTVLDLYGVETQGWRDPLYPGVPDDGNTAI